MFKNSAASAFASKKIASSKWLLLLCAASAAAVDIIIIAMLFAGGEGGEYLACPFILLIFDVFYFIVSLFFTNFRFKYSIGVWVSYILLYTLGLIIGLAIILGGSGTVLTNGAIALWAGVHAFNILCAVICALFASHIIKKLWIALAFAVLFIAGVATYAGYMFTDGFFGQGRGSRTLVYSYNKSTGQYSVTDVLAGKSKTVTVPETFNGKPVTDVSLKVFADSGIKTYNLPENIAFTGEIALNSSLDLSGKRINVDKKSVNDIREKFIGVSRGYAGYIRENALALANATLPVNLAENEGYVAFNYDITGFDAAHENTIPVYVGDLKDFDFAAYTAEYDYVAHREDGSADNYYWAFTNCGGYIYSGIDTDGGDIFNGVTKNTVATMKFEKIYRIRVDNGNDTKYDMREKQPELCFDNVGGTNEYKYLTMPKAETFLDGLIPRFGFTNRWLYYITTPANDGRYFTDLTEVLKNTEGEVPTISTRWELNRPVVSISTSAPDNTITFGENVTLSAQVKHEAEGITVKYAWNYEDELQPGWRTKDVVLTRPSPAYNAGRYKLTVTVGGDEITSLGAVRETSVDLTINRKKIDFMWSLPENRVYDGTVKRVSVSYDESQQVGGYPVSYSFSGVSWIKDAGTYNFSVHTDAITAKNYEFVNSASGVTIAPCPVEVNWANFLGLTYNGSVQSPTATATGVEADGALSVSVSGGNKNAGEYTARATVSDNNYTVTNPEQPYTIKKKQLTAALDNASVVYGERLGKVNISYSGFADGDGETDLNVTPSFYTVPAIGDDGYKVGAHADGVRCGALTTGNYDITVTYGNLTITRRTVDVAWNIPDDLTYDGTAKNITAAVGNKLAGDDVTLTVSGGNGITADGYTATVTAIAGADAGNYQLPAAVTTQYTISKRTAMVEWNLPENAVYDGMEHEVTYTIQGLVAGDEQYFTQSFKYMDVGEYTFNVVNNTYVAENYDLSNGVISFTVARAQAEITVLLGSRNVTESEVSVDIGDRFRWQSNIVGVEVEAYLRSTGNRIETNSIYFTYPGEYHLMFVIPETSNYDGKSVTITVTCSNVGTLPAPEVDQ